MVLPLEYFVLAAIYIIIPGFTVFVEINVQLVYKFIYKLALFSVLVFKCKFYSLPDFRLLKLLYK